MTTMTGSDKQISWATDIRSTVTAEVDKLKAGLIAAAVRKPGQDQVLAGRARRHR